MIQLGATIVVEPTASPVQDRTGWGSALTAKKLSKEKKTTGIGRSLIRQWAVGFAHHFTSTSEENWAALGCRGRNLTPSHLIQPQFLLVEHFPRFQRDCQTRLC